MKTLHFTLPVLLLASSPALWAAANPLAPLDALGPLKERPHHADCDMLRGAEVQAQGLRSAAVAEATARATAPLNPATYATISTSLQEMAIDNSVIAAHQDLAALMPTAAIKAGQQLQQTLLALNARKCKGGDTSCEAAKKAAGKAAYSQAASQFMSELSTPYQALEQQTRAWVLPREARLEALLNPSPPIIAGTSLGAVRNSNWLPVIMLINERQGMCQIVSSWVKASEPDD